MADEGRERGATRPREHETGSMHEPRERSGQAARSLARRLVQILGPRVVSVQLVGRGRGRIVTRDTDVLVVLTEFDPPLEQRLRALEAEVEDEFSAGLALKLTSPAHLERLGEQGTPLWDLLEGGLPLLTEGPRPAGLLPESPNPPSAPPPGRRPARTLTRAAARRRALAQLKAAETLLEADLRADAVSSAYQSMRTQALAWLPAGDLNGLAEGQVLPVFLQKLPGGDQGLLAGKVRRALRLREALDFACQDPPERAVAFEVVRDARQLYATLFAGVASSPPADAPSS